MLAIHQPRPRRFKTLRAYGFIAVATACSGMGLASEVLAQTYRTADSAATSPAHDVPAMDFTLGRVSMASNRAYAAAMETELSAGVQKFSAGDYRGALAHFERVADDNATASQYRALCHLELGDTKAALLELGRAHKPVEPSNDHLQAGLAHFANNEPVEASRELGQYLQLHPQDAYVHLVMGAIEIEQGRNEQAQAHLERALADDNLAVYAESLGAGDVGARPAEQYPESDIWASGDAQADGGVPAESYDSAAARRWNFTVLTGYQYDSNVTLSSDFVGLGSGTDQEDSSWFVASFGDYRLLQESDRNIGLIMSTYDNFYFNQNEFDFQDYMGGAYANVALGDAWIAGIRYEFHQSLLDYDEFASEHRLVPNLTFREGDFGHTTAYYEYDATQFNMLPLVPAQDRDGDAHAFGVTQAIYTFCGQGRLFLGYRYEQAFTKGTDFDRSTNMITARIERPLSERWVFDAEARQFWDDYENPNSLDFFGRPRGDQRTEARTGLQFYFTDHASVRMDYTYIYSNSNTENLFGVNFFEYDRHLLLTQFIYDF